ncbi:hydroxysteroid dehydrogenase [Coprinopsis sp. MPI-PUGE-AT-0042]|nr:hydroxysteroid dehydrogenase [Coprinopsis sp. MPI-PUGE-AT-0042]
MANFKEPKAFADFEDSQLVAEAKQQVHDPFTYDYTERDIILYNLGIGAQAQELQWTFEGDDSFGALPTFGVIPQFPCSTGIPLDWLPNYNPAKLLHGEQYLKIRAPLPTSGSLISEARIMEVLDKGKAAAVTSIVETRDASSGEVIYENQSTVFIRGAGGFGGKRTGKEATTVSQAALYRLSGRRPLDFAAIGGFDKPILHGLCSMGIAGKHVFKAYGPYEDIKVRFAGVVYPGETIITEMWKEGNKVVFRAKVKERDSVALAAAAVTLVSQSKARL